MAASAASCSFCGKTGVAFKRCSVCKEAEYCGVACQKAGWKQHKKTCAPPLSLNDVPLGQVRDAVEEADATSDWRGVLKWEGRMEELMDGQTDDACDGVLEIFSKSHMMGKITTGSNDHILSFVRLQDRRIDLLGKLERFRDQGTEMCACAQVLRTLYGKKQEAVRLFQRARKVGEAHGFFSVECEACHGLGQLSIEGGRQEEGVELLQNALAAASLSEDSPSQLEALVCFTLTTALFKTNSIDELEAIVPCFREAGKAVSQMMQYPSPTEMSSVVASARLHEARGRLQEAARDVRTLLDLLHDIEKRRATNQNMPDVTPQLCQAILQRARDELKIFRPRTGDKELIKAVAAELAKQHRLV